MSLSSNRRKQSAGIIIIPPSAAWLVVFVPALSYFLATRMHQAGFWWGRSSALGQITTDKVVVSAVSSCQKLSNILYLATACNSDDDSEELLHQLQHGLHSVQDSGLQNIVASAWRHDSELGRGYILLSDAALSGRIWRWEVGGGPIAIGKTLHLEQAGCRSNLYKQCNDDTAVGSGGIAIDFYKHDHFSEGALVVAEWGEGRIVRLEENGARTPLVLQVPDVCHNEEADATVWRRLEQPKTLLYTPFGDLLVMDHFRDCQRSALYRLRYAVHAEPLPSLSESRRAHAWTRNDNSSSTIPLPQILYADAVVESMGGIALTPTLQSILLTAKQDGSIVVLEIPIDTDDDDEETKGDAKHPDIIFNVSRHFPSVQAPGAVAVSRKGYIFLAASDSILIVFQSTLLGQIQTPAQVTSLTLGEDGFLYVTTERSLLRIRVREGPVKIPTNLVLRPINTA